MTQNLGAPQVAAAQNQKEVTINDAVGRLDAAVTEDLSVDFTSGDVTLTDTQFQSNVKFTAANLSVARDLTVPVIKHLFIVDNVAGTAALGVARGATSISVPAGDNGLFHTDGTTDGLIQIAGGVGGGGSGIRVEDEGVQILAAATALNFVGAGVTVTDGGSDEATVTIPGAGATSINGYKDPVRVATTAAATLASDFENGDTVDGVVLATNDRVLIKDQSTAAENGIYTVNASGSPTRAVDFDEDAEVEPGVAVAVAEGAENGDTLWMLTTDGAITVGTTDLVFEKFADVAAEPYDFGSFFPGAPANDELLIRHVFTRSVVFPSGLTGSQGFLGVAATAQTDFDIRKNAGSVGTMRFAAAGTTATFIFASEQTFAPGDRLSLVAPATADATAADVSYTLAGTR